MVGESNGIASIAIERELTNKFVDAIALSWVNQFRELNQIIARKY